MQGTAGKQPSRPLVHPPLSQVAFEVNFPNSFAVETEVAKYQQRVQAFYPESSAEYIVRLPTAVAFGKPPKQDSASLIPMRSFVFQNLQHSRVVRVSVVNFTFVVTDYLHFEDYLEALTAAIVPAVEIFQLQNANRIGLRYINHIPIPGKGAETEYQKYVRSSINVDFLSGRIPSSFLTEVSLDLGSAKGLTVRSGLLPAEPDRSARTYLLDIDCFSPGQVALSTQDIKQLLSDYHDAIETQFLRTVTEPYLKHMAEGSAI